MDTLVHETETATFSFELDEITEILNRSKNKTQERDELLNFISSSTKDPIKIPEECDYFASIALDLVNEGKGLVFCKPCGKTYQADQLKPITVGHGKTPFLGQNQDERRDQIPVSKETKTARNVWGKGICMSGRP